MQQPGYYREQAGRARRLAGGVSDRQVGRQLQDMAQDYEELADEIETGVVEVRRPDLRSSKQQEPD